MRYKGEDRERTGSFESRVSRHLQWPVGFTFQAYISRSLVLEDDGSLLMVAAAFGARVSISSSLCRTLESSSCIAHAGDIVVLKIPSRGVLPPRRMAHVIFIFNIRVSQKCFKEILEKSIKLVLSRVRRRRREDEFLLI